MEGLDPSECFLDYYLDGIFDLIDGWLSKHRYDCVDHFMRTIIVEQCSPTILIGYLTATGWARHSLPSRHAFYNRVEEYLLTLLPEEKVNALLQGLK
jgi:hypothetical protein